MDKQEFTEILQSKFKIVRTEAGYTQDAMSHTIGLSKKTLVQIEKERILPNWTTCISLCALFRDSEVLTNIFWRRSTGTYAGLIKRLSNIPKL
jgi:Predicted transcriptional regulators